MIVSTSSMSTVRRGKWLPRTHGPLQPRKRGLYQQNQKALQEGKSGPNMKTSKGSPTGTTTTQATRRTTSQDDVTISTPTDCPCPAPFPMHFTRPLNGARAPRSATCGVLGETWLPSCYISIGESRTKCTAVRLCPPPTRCCFVRGAIATAVHLSSGLGSDCGCGCPCAGFGFGCGHVGGRAHTAEQTANRPQHAGLKTAGAHLVPDAGGDERRSRGGT